jgi:hypothetical protein
MKEEVIFGQEGLSSRNAHHQRDHMLGDVSLSSDIFLLLRGDHIRARIVPGDRFSFDNSRRTELIETINKPDIIRARQGRFGL